MASIVDERGFNQGFARSEGQIVRLQRRAAAIAREMKADDHGTSAEEIRVLELGCGTGELAFELAKITGAWVTGVDLSPQFIKEAASAYRHPKLKYQVADLERETPELVEQQYHFIVGNGILHHLYHHLDTFLPQLRKSLVGGGKLIFWEPNLFNPYVFLIFSFPMLRRVARLEPGEMAFTSHFIRQKLDKAGFEPVEVTTRDFLVPHTPVPLIGPIVKTGSYLEHSPLRFLAQSVFISATNPPNPEQR